MFFGFWLYSTVSNGLRTSFIYTKILQWPDIDSDCTLGWNSCSNSCVWNSTSYDRTFLNISLFGWNFWVGNCFAVITSCHWQLFAFWLRIRIFSARNGLLDKFLINSMTGWQRTYPKPSVSHFFSLLKNVKIRIYIMFFRKSSSAPDT